MITKTTTLSLSFAATLAAAALASPVDATMITVDVTGAPQTGKCNITDAIQAASTNTAVRGCAAGSSTSTDTIQLAANTMYQGYGKVLHIPATGGALVIQGTAAKTSVIRAQDYGFPSPNPINADVCQYPAAIFSGGTVTLTNVQVQSIADGTTGICQYAGSLTLNGTLVGDTLHLHGFNRGGVVSRPNTIGLHRTMNVTNGSAISGNYSFQPGGGLGVVGNVDVTITAANIRDNFTESSGGGIAWTADDGSTKMGNLTITTTNIFTNTSFSWGGGLFLDGRDPNATVNVQANIQQNVASITGGAILVNDGLGANKVIVRSTFFNGNAAQSDVQQSTFNSDASTYNAVSCRTNSTVDQMHGSEWTHTPPLKGDGTCVFP